MAIIREWVDRITVLSLCIMIFTLPFSKSALEISFVVTLVSWVIKRALYYEPHAASFKNLFTPVSPGLNFFVYLFILAGAASVIVSPSVFLSLKGFFSKLLKGAILLFIIAETIDGKNKLKLVLVFMLYSMAFIGIDGIFQYITGRDFIRHYHVMNWENVRYMPFYCRSISASFMNINSFGGWLTIMLPLTIGLIYVEKIKQFKKFILCILAGILALCLVLTRSNGALLGMAFTILFFGAWKKGKIFLIVVAFISVISLIMAPHFINIQLSFNKCSLLSLKDYLVQIMLRVDIVRTHLWREALLIIKDFPVFGCGLNTYSIVAPGYKSGLAESGIYPHNSYLQMAAETGIVGLTAFMCVIFALFKISLNNLRKIKDRFYSSLLIGLLAGMTGFLVHSFFDVNFYALQLANLMWFTMGLIIAVQRIALREENGLGGLNVEK